MHASEVDILNNNSHYVDQSSISLPSVPQDDIQDNTKMIQIQGEIQTYDKIEIRNSNPKKYEINMQENFVFNNINDRGRTETFNKISDPNNNTTENM